MFTVGIWLKFLNGLLEITGSIFLLFVPLDRLNAYARILVLHELAEDPKDLIANAFIHAWQKLLSNNDLILAFYLLLHGLVKVGLFVALQKGKMWAYPLAEGMLGLFTVYQLYLFMHLHSLIQLVLSVIDILVMISVWLEYQRIHIAQRS